MRSSASSFKLQYLQFTLRSSSSCLRLLLRLPLPFIFHSVIRLRRHMLRKTSPMKSAHLHFIPYRIFLYSFTLYFTSSFLTRLVQLIFPVFLQNHNSELSRNVYTTTTDIQRVGVRVQWLCILPSTLFSRNLFS